MSSTLKVDILQDSGGNAILTSDGSGNVTQNKTGILEIDAWHLTSDFSFSTGNATTHVNSGWTRWSQGGFTKKGTGVTESSGTFSFPSTGYWQISAQAYANGNAVSSYLGAMIYTTNDDSTYTRRYSHFGSTPVANHYTPIAFTIDFKCSDTSNDKIRFYGLTQVATGKFDGNSSTDFRTGLTFIRLGDT